MSRQLTLGSLFDGIGGFPLAASLVGIRPVWASEIERFPINVTHAHFPDMLQFGDVTKLDGAKLPPVDIIAGGSPCQDLSVANGYRKGLAGERSGLFMDQIRIIKEMRNADRLRGRTTLDVRPRWMVWENVPGAFSSANGEDFLAVLQETVAVADGSVSVVGPPSGVWQSAGTVLGSSFSVSWRIIDAQFFGVPQRRRRVFLVADFAGHSAPQILFKSESLPGYSAPRPITWERLAATAGTGIENTGRDTGTDCAGTG